MAEAEAHQQNAQMTILHPRYGKLLRLKMNQQRVRGCVWHAGQGRPLDNEILSLPWGWMVPAG